MVFAQTFCFGEGMILRLAAAPDLDVLARSWHDEWHDAHAALMPGLVPFRSLDSFRERLPALLPETSVVERDTPRYEKELR
jgi:hypothetical protein